MNDCANCGYKWIDHFGDACVEKFTNPSGKISRTQSLISKYSPIVSPVATTIPPTQFNYTNMCATCGKAWGSHYLNSTPSLSCAPNGNQYFVLAAQTKPSNTQPGDMFGNPCAEIDLDTRVGKAIDTAKAMRDNQPAINDHTCPTCKNTRVSKCERMCWKCGGVL
jgi:hypothetical protein